MVLQGIQRRLAAIISSDVKEYSRLVAEDEVTTIRRLTLCKELMTEFIAQHLGRVVDSPGDNLLAEFASAVNAVQCAVNIQQDLKGRNDDLPAHRRMEFRMGISLGDVIVEGDRIFGDGVNIAARLEGLADGGGICISGAVYDIIKNKMSLDYMSLGEQSLKNICEPVSVYRLKLPDRLPIPEQDGGHYLERGLCGMRILLVEDDAKIATFVSKGLEQAGFAVDRAAEGEDGLYLATNQPYDAAIIDIMLPKLDGLTLIERMRQQHIRTPVIILSAKRSVDDRVTGLQTGGDDYIVKPFAFSELLARVQALIRRATQVTEPSSLKAGDLTMNLLTREVTRAETKIELQPREFALLEYLMRNAGRVLSKTMILEHVWNYSFDPQTNVVDVLICRLRNKVDKDFDPKMIHTVRGVGYVLKIA